MDLQVLEHTEGNHKIEFMGDGDGGIRITVKMTIDGDRKVTDFNLTRQDVNLLVAFIETKS